MKKSLLLSGLLFGSVYAHTELDDTALHKMGDCFLADLTEILFTDEAEQEAYRQLYSKFLEGLSMMSDARRERKLQSVYKWAARSLHDKHLGFYQSLQRSGQFDPETQTKATRTLLTRYAVYEKMQIVKEHNWQEVKQVVTAYGKRAAEYGKRAATTVSKATRSLKEWLVS